MSFDRSLPPPVLGISTLPEVTRPEGYASIQTNWRNDAQNKLTRRPPTQHVANNPDVSASISYNSSAIEVEHVDGQRYEIHVYANSSTRQVEIVVAGLMITRSTLTVGAEWFSVNGSPTAADLGVSIALRKVYVWNRNTEVGITSSQVIDEHYANVSLVNITSALNYAETVTLSVFTDGVENSRKATWTVPGLTGSNQDAADEARATNKVATELAAALEEWSPAPVNPGDPDSEPYFPELRWVRTLGSNIYVEWKSSANTCRLEVSTGRGDGSIVIANNTITGIEGLPKYCFPEVVRSVVPDPTSADGRYYLVATPTEATTSNKMVEVVWTETSDPTDRKAFVRATLPLTAGDIVAPTALTQVDWDPRQTGDEDSNPQPDFVGNTISEITDFQDRLLLLSKDKVVLSKTEDENRFWRDSATSLLVTDTTSVGTSKNNSTLRHVVFHNRDLIVFAENAQFKIDGQNPVTPQTVAMPIVTENECDLTVPPVLMNAAVFYASSYGNSAGVRRFEVEADTVVDKSVSMTDHVVGLLPGGLVEMASNANQTMLVCRTEDSNRVYVFEQQVIGDQPVFAWSLWELPTGIAIKKMSVYNEELWVLYDDAGTMKRLTCSLKQANADRLHMDCMRDASVLGDGTIVLNDMLATGTPTAVISDGRERWAYMDLEQVSPGVWQPTDYLAPGEQITVGYRYTSTYQPSTIYERNRDGSVRTTDRLRVVHHILELSNTYHLVRRIVARYWELPDEVFSSLLSSDDDLASREQYTGQWKPQIGMQNTDCQVQYITDQPYPATIAAMAYRAQQYSTRTRR